MLLLAESTEMPSRGGEGEVDEWHQAGGGQGDFLTLVKVCLIKSVIEMSRGKSYKKKEGKQKRKKGRKNL